MASSSQVRRSRRDALQAQRVADAHKERRNRLLFVSAGVVVLALVVGLGIWGYIAATQTQGGTDVPPNANSAGNGITLAAVNPDLPTFEMFSDYNCSACKSANLTLSAVLDQAAAQGKANVIIHSLSFEGATSRDAAIAASCADFQGKFTDFHNQLYINQSSDGFDATMLTSTIPDAIGLTGDALTAFTTCVNTQATGKFVDAEAAYGAKMKVTSTPTFLFKGDKVNSQLFNSNTNTYDPDLLRAMLNMS
ncbi:MAG: thioredoxin domain-containing protein [Propionibacteriaceae bacterium]|nr:thioredoxin domain-containing protein [Propionibacteriaceae bacterium]